MPQERFQWLRESGHSLVVKRYPSKLDMRVRFPLPAPVKFARHYPSFKMKKIIFSAIITASFGVLPSSAAVDCINLSLSVKNAVSAEPSKVLEVVSAQVGAAPDCACEVVKSAIETTKANTKTVAAIVEAAATAAPEQMRLVSQCAVAVSPESLAAVQAVIAKLDPNLGDSAKSSKSSKDSKAPAGEVASMPNPLDFPGQGPIGPTPGGPGGLPLIPQLPPVIIAPPDVSNVNP